MSKLIYTSNIPFDLRDWADQRLVKVVAGACCVMAIDDQGNALQKVFHNVRRIDPDYWYDLTDIAVSKGCEGVAIGLRSDGTCEISGRALRSHLGREYAQQMRYREICREVESWENIVQVACSDAFFALDARGNVHYSSFVKGDYGYREILEWKNVVRIIPGPTSDALFGITAEGNVLAAGANLTRGPGGDVRTALAALEDVVDISASGGECENIVYITKDGRFRGLYDDEPEEGFARTAPVLEGHYVTNLVRREAGGAVMRYHCYDIPLQEVENWKSVKALSVGDAGIECIFAIGLQET